MNMYKVALDVCECVDRQHGHLKFNPCRRLWADSDRYIHVYIYSIKGINEWQVHGRRWILHDTGRTQHRSICMDNRLYSSTSSSSQLFSFHDLGFSPERSYRGSYFSLDGFLIAEIGCRCRCRLVSQACLPSRFRSWLPLPPCFPSLSPVMISLLAASAALSPKLVPLHDFAFGCRCRLVSQACLPS